MGEAFLPRMQHQNSLKKEFLNKWIMGLQICISSSKENMTLLDRKKVIKLSADLAMASTRSGRRSWSRAVITKASKDNETGTLAKQILSMDRTNCLSQDDPNATYKHRMMFTRTNNKKAMSQKRSNTRYTSRRCGPHNSYKVKARSLAKRLVNKRAQILKGLVPGGEYMDDYSLIKETLDYIVSLRAQVDVMHHLANSTPISASLDE